VAVTPDGTEPAAAERVPALIGRLGAACVAVETGLPAGRLLRWRDSLPDGAVRWRALTGELRRLRARKDAVEVTLLGLAAAATARALAAVLAGPLEGMPEYRLLADYQRHLFSEGVDPQPAFDPSVATGDRTSALWAGVSARSVAADDAVTLDVGLRFRGYHSDVARSGVVVRRRGDVPAEWRRRHDAVRAALDAALAECRAGSPVAALAAASGSALAAHGYPGPMGHCLGHGVGLEPHELPVVDDASDAVLEPGMVVCLEPSVLAAGGPGVRIEETVLVTDQGYRLLSRPSQEEACPDGVLLA
jgi:Xaa-Pro aminopeptidase